jgi:cyclic beta-1,2-glucan synthetase
VNSVIKQIEQTDSPQEFDLQENSVALSGNGNGHNPWCWETANRRFGMVQSDKAMNFTFYENAREFKLTEWKNDIFDEAGESLVLTVKGIKYDLLAISHSCIHSAAGSIYRFQAGTLAGTVEITTFSKLGGKLVRMKLDQSKNKNEERVRIEYACSMVLGVDRRDTLRIAAEKRGGVIFLKNPFAGYFSNTTVCLIADRNFENRFTGGVLSCAHTVDAGGEVCFCLCAFRDEREYQLIRSEFKAAGFDGIRKGYLKEIEPYLSKIQIKTPDDKLNWLFNNALVYQSLTSRIWARSGFYQCGGAFGFRDQLQDYLNLSILMPEELKRHIIRCCTHQFVEGDVQHWWHNIPTGKDKGHLGVRTRCSDDLLWLIPAAASYIEATGEDGILDIITAYIEAPPLQDNESEICIIPSRSAVRESILQHCRKAMDFAFRTGPNGLLLIRSGDWNDSMNMAGDENRGESVWLSWFYIRCCRQMEEFYRARHDEEESAEMQRRAEKIEASIESNAYDGAWYLRGYHKDGSKIGNAGASECEIDLISQSFSVIAGGNVDDKRRGAVLQAYNKLYDREAKIYKLFWPPFKNDGRELGYIKGYLEGIRENGGQYTHAAIWGAIALFICGETEKAYEVLSGCNPANRCANDTALRNYRVEPYVIAADIYTNPNTFGMGGWTWNTGAAAWYFTAVLRYMLGINIQGDAVECIAPKIPEEWKDFSIEIKFPEKTVRVDILRKNGMEQGRKDDSNRSRKLEGNMEILEIYI